MSKTIKAALAGNPNSGKTTLFNALTGARQHVGNYPGITVDKKEGRVTRGDTTLNIIDLPGTYSLTAFSQEELVARHVLLDERPDVCVDVLNAAVLERNLYLAVQLMEMGIPVVLALNMMDELKRQGTELDTKRLSELLKLPVVETVAKSGKGVDRLVEEAVALVEKTQGKWTPLNISYGPDLDPVIAEMTEHIGKAKGFPESMPPRWVAVKYLEGDDDILSYGERNPELHAKLSELVEKVAEHCQATLQTYPEAIIADYRYGFISSVLKQGVIKVSHEQRVATSDNMDKVLTHKLLGPVIMLLILYFIYQITFVVGEIPMGWMESFFGWMGDTATSLIPEGLFQSLIVSGIIDGVGGVLGFVPLIMIIFFIISFLEDSGYMARIAYMLDRVFRIFGLHGCSVMPFIVSGGIAGGCAVPGVMAARTLRSPKEKLATLLTAPFMTCGAKLPVFILLVGVFFKEHQGLALFAVTLTAWAFALIVAKLLRMTLIKGESTPFVMELPPYRLPTLRGLLIHTWERSWQYIKKAGTVILAISILLWAAMTFPGLPESEQAKYEQQTAAITAQLESPEVQTSEDTKAQLEDQLVEVADQEAQASLRNSVAGKLGTSIDGITKYAGFDWRTNIALIGGIAAKEVIVSTLGTAYSLGEVDPDDSQSLAEKLATDKTWTMATAVSLMLFIMLYAPCFVTVVAIKQEAGSWKWAAFSVVFNTVFAFAISTIAYQILTI
ncbi:MAG: ferrous iron transport protein B [Desulfovibrio sp.]|uniref:ferrous iron transport protein B n=1 Tax=Desulfovibrio sp. 7SRBS1 TaxID=3378064 RepID=UPI003B3D6581